MGLDACVYCNCFEAGNLREEPPPDWNIAVAENGRLVCGSAEPEVVLAFEQWVYNRACEHVFGRLVQRRLGNIALLAGLSAELKREAHRFPLLLSKVLASGIHTGDYLPVDVVWAMQPELAALRSFRCTDPQFQPWLRVFATQMSELADWALKVRKPIAF
jgi:hypothetical protein